LHGILKVVNGRSGRLSSMERAQRASKKGTASGKN
jgi:hypothetical protein